MLEVETYFPGIVLKKGGIEVTEKREQWGSRVGFILAAAGSAVGLGNIWRFPYITGKYGGAVFVLFYLIIVAVIGMSLMLAEFAIGRGARKDAVGSMKLLGGNAWSVAGWLGFLSAFVILSYYSVIMGWAFAYMLKSLTGLMAAAVSGEASGAFFSAFVSDAPQTLGYHTLMIVMMFVVIYMGVTQGIEKFCKVLMPALFVLLLMLIVRSLTLPGAGAGVAFYMQPKIANLTREGMLAAVGQAFFSLSLAMGAMITYGSYVSKDESLPSATVSVVFIDTLIAILAGFVIFPGAFAFGIEPGAGVGLTFITLPVVFSRMPLGALFSFAFFLLLFIAAFTSGISLLEVSSAYAIDNLHYPRKKAVALMSALIFLLGIPSALSVGGHIGQIAGKDFLDAADYLTNNVMMPIGAILITLFVGWVWTDGAKAEVTNDGKLAFPLYTMWLWTCRVIAPVAVAVIFITGLKWG